MDQRGKVSEDQTCESEEKVNRPKVESNNVEEFARNIVGDLNVICAKVEEFKDSIIEMDATPEQNKGEMIANAMLSFRHLEDAMFKLERVRYNNNLSKLPK